MNERVKNWAQMIRDGIQIVAGVSFLLTALLFLADHPAFKNKVGEWAGTKDLKEQIEEIDSSLRLLSTRVEKIEETHLASALPPVKFLRDNISISDGKIGDFVKFTIRYIQLRNCGRPQIVAAFQNGGENVHTFIDLTIVDDHGQGLVSPADPDEVLERHFKARIPGSAGVEGGRAIGWVEFGPYSLCPNVPTIYSPKEVFIIENNEGESL